VEPVSEPASPEPVEPPVSGLSVAPVPTASTYAREAAPDTHPASVIPSSIVFPNESGATSTGHAHSSHADSQSASWPDAPHTDGPKPRGAGRKVAGVLAIALLGAAAGVGGGAVYEEYLAPDRPSISTVDQPSDTSKAPAGQVEKVAASVLPSVVQIMVSGGDAAGSGTGIIISNDGEILTNNHVVEVADGDDGKIVVVFSDGTNTPAKIVGQDPVTDIAVIKAQDVKGLAPAALGSTRNLQVGQTVVAVGSPFGLSSSVTSGIISALNRPVTEPTDDEDEKSSGTTFPGIQTDAAINPGNSGGPLVDLKGRVIGINSVIQSSGGGLFGGEAGSIGLGFAIPIDLAKSVASQLLDGKKVEHAQIGVTVSAAVADNKLTTIGALIRDVKKGSAGAKAGLKSGDIITAVNNIPVARSEGLIAAIRAYEPGEKVTLTYLRDDKKRTTEVTLGSDGGKLSQ
jgi:putative serine protease PepD